MTGARLQLSRAQILGFRRTVGALGRRLPLAPESLRRAAWAGLQDSMPRAALLSIHARVAGTQPSTWEDPSLVQIWGPRYSAYVVAAEDVAVFTLGRLPDDRAGLARAERIAGQLDAFLAGRRMDYAEAGRALGVHPNALRYAAPTGRVLIRWDAAGRPVVWTVPAPEVDPAAARLELARRYLHVFGPGTAASFGTWAGVKPPRADRVFAALAPELVAVQTSIGEAWILAADEPAFGAVATEAPAAEAAMAPASASLSASAAASDSDSGTRSDSTAPPLAVRFLPSGDTYYLLQGRDRELLVPGAARRAALWTSRVWPGALLIGGEIVGTWRRSDADVAIAAWRELTGPEREAVETEAKDLPLPGITRPTHLEWGSPPG